MTRRNPAIPDNTNEDDAARRLASHLVTAIAQRDHQTITNIIGGPYHRETPINGATAIAHIRLLLATAELAGQQDWTPEGLQIAHHLYQNGGPGSRDTRIIHGELIYQTRQQNPHNKPIIAENWTIEELRAAHEQYQTGDRDEWTQLGEAFYQRIRKEGL